MYIIHVNDKVPYEVAGNKSVIKGKLTCSQDISEVNKDKLSLFLGTLN